MVGSHFKQWNYKQKAKKGGKCGPKETAKRTLVSSVRTERRRASPCLTSHGNVCSGELKFFAALCMFTPDHEGPQALIWGLEINYTKFTNMKSINKRINCLLSEFPCWVIWPNKEFFHFFLISWEGIKDILNNLFSK